MPQCRRRKRAKAAELAKKMTLNEEKSEKVVRNEREKFLDACAAGNTEALKMWNENQSVCDCDGNNGVLFAAMHGQLMLLKGFASLGADLNSVNANGDNALHLAAFQGHQEVVEWLEEHGVGIYVDNEEENGDLDGWGQVAVRGMYFDLVRNGDIDGLQQLVANVGEHIFLWNVVDEYQVNAIGIACENNQLEMLKYLTHVGGLSLATNVNNQRDTALHIVAMYGFLDLVREIAPKIDLTLKNAQKWTALDIACFYSQASVVWYLTNEFKSVFELSISQAFLIIEGEQPSAPSLLAQVIEKDSSLLTQRHGTAQETLFHVSASLKQLSICKCLLSMGADALLTDGSGWSTLQVVLNSKWYDGIPLFFTSRLWCENSTLLQFAMEYATLDMLLALYKLTASSHIFYQEAKKANRYDVVCAIDKLHESQAEAIISQLSIVSAPKVKPINIIREPKKPTPSTTTIPVETPTIVPTQVCDNQKQSGLLRIQYLLTSDFSAGEHDDWGEVLIQSFSKREAMAARRFQQQLIRWEWSQPTSTQSFVRYLGSIDCNDMPHLLFELPGIPWSLAFQKPNTFACANHSTRDLMKSAIEALDKLHCQSHPHGLISTSCLFIDATYSHTKLYVPLNDSSSINPIQTAPEVHEGRDIDLFALD
ncbi:hypothetical protein THRCLA_08863, partial [Thraustotheca clavata]